MKNDVCNYLRSERGSVLIAGIFVMAAIMAIVATTVSRSVTNVKVTKNKVDMMDESIMRRSIINKVILKAKDYAWTTGQSLNDLLPAGSERFNQWYQDTYEGTSYTVSVADNSDETGTQNFRADTDNKFYLRITADYPSGQRIIQILMTPGAPAAPGSEPPGGLPSGIGVCYGWLNLITLMSMNPSSTISGYNTTPDGWTGCSTSGGCPVGSGDQLGVASTSWFGYWALGTYFDLTHSHHGAVIGAPGPDGDPLHSYGRPTAEDCDNFDSIQTLADNMLAQNDPSLTLYQKNFFNKNVNGNLVFGTEAAPEVLYIKTGIFGTVTFKGTVSGVGIMIADGNVKFQKDVAWNGIIINDANAIGNVMKFEEDTTVNGAMIINRPILSAEIGSVSLDFNFAALGNADITYSSEVINGILGNLDPNYTPPAGGSEGQSLAIAAIQDI